MISTAKFPPNGIAAFRCAGRAAALRRPSRSAFAAASCRQLAGHDLREMTCVTSLEPVRDRCPALAPHRSPVTKHRLTLGELESLSCAFLPVLLAFLHSGIARQKTVFPQGRPQLCIESRNRTRQSHAHGAGLPAHTAATGAYHYVHLVDQVAELQRLGRLMLPRMIREILLHGSVINGELPRTRTKEHPCYSFLTPPSSHKPCLRAR